MYPFSTSGTTLERSRASFFAFRRKKISQTPRPPRRNPPIEPPMAPPRSAGLGPESESESLSAGPVSFGDVDAVVLVPSSLVVGVVSWLDDVVVASEVSVDCVDWTDFVAARIVVRTEGSSHS